MMTASIRRWCEISIAAMALLALPAASAWSQASSASRPGAAAADDGEPGTASGSAPARAETDPWVRAILEVKPTTPEQWLADVRALLDLSRPELAKEYLQQFSAAMPPAAALPALHARFGSAFFLRLANLESLQPEGAAVAEAVLQAADAHHRDPQRLAALVQQRIAEDPAGQRLALAELVRVGAPSVGPVLVALAQTDQAEQQQRLAATLVALGPTAVDPLVAALGQSNTAVRTHVIDALVRLEARQALPALLPLASSREQDSAVRDAAQRALRSLLGDLPTHETAVTVLTNRLQSLLGGTVPGSVNELEQVTVWRWDEPAQTLTPDLVPAADARLVAAAQIARQLYALAPATPEHQRWYLATALEQAQRRVGYEVLLTDATDPIVSEAREAGSAVLESVLLWAREQNLQGAVGATIHLLGTTGDISLLDSSDGSPRPLVQSLRSAHRRVQWAAAQAIMQLDPRRPYAGASYLPEVLGHLAATGGRRRVLIADPRAEVARTLAGLFDELGFDVDTQLTGRSTILQAFASPDYVFLLVGDAVVRPGYREVIQTLRRDPRTADLPIGLMVRQVNEGSVQWLVEPDPLTLAFAQPQSREDIARDTRLLLEAAGRLHVSLDERLVHAAFALDALGQLAEHPDRYGFYDLLRVEEHVRRALIESPFAARAARVLGLLGSPTAQQALMDYANAHVLPLANRQAAADAFRVAVQRRGVLLTGAQLQRQYDMYNASALLDGDTQQVLASILDTIEGAGRKTDPSAPDKR